MRAVSQARVDAELAFAKKLDKVSHNALLSEDATLDAGWGAIQDFVKVRVRVPAPSMPSWLTRTSV